MSLFPPPIYSYNEHNQDTDVKIDEPPDWKNNVRNKHIQGNLAPVVWSSITKAIADTSKKEHSGARGRLKREGETEKDHS